MRYTIEQHLKFKLRKPYKRRAALKGLPVDYQTADERKDGETKLKVNVLIMAKAKKKNNRVTAGELLGKLGRKQEPRKADDVPEEEFLEESAYEADEEMEFDAIDVSSGAEGEASDSDLDINELLRKYMPEYDGSNASDDAEEPALGGGILSKLKKTSAETASQAEVQPKNDDEKLIDALDSVFKMAPAQEEPADGSADDAEMNDEFADDDTILEYELDEAPAEEENIGEDELPMDPFAEEEKTQKKRGFFANLFTKSAKPEEPVYETQEADTDEEPDLLLTEKEQIGEEDAFSDDVYRMTPADEADASAAVTAEPEDMADAPEEEPAVMNTELSLGAEEESMDDAELSDAGAEESGEAEPDDDIDPTDINLMVAFGLDGGENRKADRAKELGDRLEAKQTGKSKKFKLDRPEYVDKTQTPQIRKEFRDREVSLWIRLAICAVFTFLLMIFENISVLTGLFTGTPKQFAGVLDPAVYPVVYIMISLQLMLLACLCAFDEIVAGFKYIFRGTPKPESMTAILTVAGIIYSIVLSHLISVPDEPVMFNFIVALSALLTLIYSIYNNKREMMNFRVVSNKRPKHIVRRLLDEESECESKAFSEEEDVCDVMKLEKTDFVDGFFGRLHAPEAGTGIFMTFIMSVAAAIAVLFGIFVNFRGGDATMVARVIYSAMLIIAPLSVYMTFSYPFYRANVAAKQYDSAIIGETSLEEYSNASIISFDDKNVFPSYSVKVQNFRVFNNARIDRVLYYAASAFAYAGGPLQDVFEVVTKDMGISNNVQIFDTEAGFLATQVDGVNIIFGSCEGLRSRGLEIDDDAAQDDVDFSDALEIMYMFRENKLVAKMYIQYVMDSDIDLILKQFSGSGLYVCVRTFDPNIDERMIARKLNMKRIPLKIVRYASADEVGTYSEKVNSGLVTCGTPKSLLQVISYCGKVLHTKKTNIALSVLSVMIGVAILVLLLLSDSLGSLNSLFIALYQLIWLIPMMISSKMFIR